jgi:hypothetical protein
MQVMPATAVATFSGAKATKLHATTGWRSSMLHGRSVRGGLLVIASMLAASPAFADTILLTRGFLALDRSTSSIHLEGERGFSLDSTNPIPAASDPGVICNGTPNSCIPGSAVSFLVGSAGSDLGGQATLDGQSFQVGFGSATQGSAAINFTSSFVVPAFAGTTDISVLMPFSFSGFLQPPSGNGTPILETLVGSGTVRFDLQWVTRGGESGWDFQRARYSFDEATPVPEPGTVLLVGSCLAMCVARRRRALQR